jgi:hypothetical protein
VLAFEAALGVRFDWLLHVGDFGVWPDPERVDGATKRHDGAGDFLAWFAARRAAPRPTVVIKGNHEDFVWLDAQPSSEVLPGLHYLRNGHVHELVAGDEVVRVGGRRGRASASSGTTTPGSTRRSRACAASGSTRGTTPAASSPSR